MNIRPAQVVWSVVLACVFAALPVYAATDSFTRTDATDLGANWHRNSISGGGFGITSNQAAVTATSNDRIETWSAETFGANQYSSVVLITYTGTSNQTGCGTSLRWDQGTVKTGYWVVVNTAGTNNVSIHRFNAGTATLLQQVTHSWTSGHILRAEISGYTITVKDNGTAFTSIEDTSGSKIASGQPGLAYSSTLSAICTVDDWDGNNLAATISSLGTLSASIIPRLTLKTNTDQWAPVVLKDPLDSYPVAGVAGNQVTLYYRRGLTTDLSILPTQSGDGSATGQDCATDGTETPESGDWCESAPGIYRVYLPASTVTTAGRLTLLITGTGLASIYQDATVKDYLDEEESAQTGSLFVASTGPDGFSAIKNDTSVILSQTGTTGVKLTTAEKNALGWLGTVTIASINTWITATNMGNLVTIVESAFITVDGEFAGDTLKCGDITYRIRTSYAASRQLELTQDHYIPNSTTGTCEVFR